MIYSENILICIALPLLIMLPFIQRKVRRYFIAILLGMTMCLMGAYLNSFFATLYEMDEVRTAKFIAPIIEEIMKMIPVIMFLIISMPNPKEITNYAAAVGAGFATFENCCYITQNGAELFRFVLLRGLATGLMHIVCGLLIGFGIGLAVKFRSIMLTGMIGAFTFAMIIHALFNLLVATPGLSSTLGVMLPSVSILILYVGKNKLYEIE